MPIIITQGTAGGVGYIDVRMDPGKGEVHQTLLDVTALAGSKDAAGYLPPGLPILAAGGPVTGAGQTAKYVLGPNPWKVPGANQFGNVLYPQTLNRDAVEDNLGRALSADEVSALAAGGFRFV